MIISKQPVPPVVMTIEEVTDPVELARWKARKERADRNVACWQASVKEVYSRHRGKCVCFAGGSISWPILLVQPGG